MNARKNDGFIISFLFFFNAIAQASPEVDSAAFLERFRQNPSKAIQEIPVKYDSNGRRLPRAIRKEISDEYFEALRKHRQRFNLDQAGRAGIRGNDRPENLVDNPRLIQRNLFNLDKSFRVGRIEGNPWSSDYWPTRTGMTAIRYRDRQFPADPKRFSWTQAWNYFKLNQPEQLVENGQIDNLSPAEKYDLLVGDSNFTLTRAQWAEGEYYQKTQNNVEPWMGLCHGWAVAAYVEKRPTVSFELTAADGQTRITFYPDDVKALTVLKWSNGQAITRNGEDANRFVGGRCDVKKPKTDKDSGRIIDQDCFDTNPGTWHLAVTHQIGRNKRSFIMDSTYDYEVWNHPIVAYSTRYFNPKTKKNVSNIQEARVRLDDPEFSDTFAKFRDNPRAVEVVGVVMTVEYLVETGPHGAHADHPSYDATQKVTYHYDLELDGNGNIVGGEWYNNAHPDFLWGVTPGAIAYNQEDARVQEKFIDGLDMPQSIRRVAPIASRNSRPLLTIIEALIEKSQYRN